MIFAIVFLAAMYLLMELVFTLIGQLLRVDSSLVRAVVLVPVTVWGIWIGIRDLISLI